MLGYQKKLDAIETLGNHVITMAEQGTDHLAYGNRKRAKLEIARADEVGELIDELQAEIDGVRNKPGLLWDCGLKFVGTGDYCSLCGIKRENHRPKKG